MIRLGKNLLFFGVGSIVLNFIHMQFVLLAWIDLWGEGIGWTIRISLILAGAACFAIGKAQAERAPQT